jgi:bacteriorhodopsin
MPKWAWIALVAVAVAGLVWWLTRKPNQLPSGNTADQPATLNPTVATTSYGK